MTDKKGKTALDGFIRIVNESKSKPSKLWVDQERELYNKRILKFLDNSNLLINANYNESMSVVAKRFIRNLKGKIYKKMTARNNRFFLITYTS